MKFHEADEDSVARLLVLVAVVVALCPAVVRCQTGDIPLTYPDRSFDVLPDSIKIVGAAASNDTVLAVWGTTELRYDGKAYPILVGQRIIGKSVSGGLIRVTDTAARPHHALIVCPVAGGFRVVWNDARSQDTLTWTTFVDSLGAARLSEGFSPSPLNRDSSFSSAVLPCFGNAVILWRGREDGKAGVFGRRVDATGSLADQEYRYGDSLTFAYSVPELKHGWCVITNDYRHVHLIDSMGRRANREVPQWRFWKSYRIRPDSSLLVRSDTALLIYKNLYDSLPVRSIRYDVVTRYESEHVVLSDDSGSYYVGTIIGNPDYDGTWAVVFLYRQPIVGDTALGESSVVDSDRIERFGLGVHESRYTYYMGSISSRVGCGGRSTVFVGGTRYYSATPWGGDTWQVSVTLTYVPLHNGLAYTTTIRSPVGCLPQPPHVTYAWRTWDSVAAIGVGIPGSPEFRLTAPTAAAAVRVWYRAPFAVRIGSEVWWFAFRDSPKATGECALNRWSGLPGDSSTFVASTKITLRNEVTATTKVSESGYTVMAADGRSAYLVFLKSHYEYEIHFGGYYDWLYEYSIDLLTPGPKGWSTFHHAGYQTTDGNLFPLPTLHALAVNPADSTRIISFTLYDNWGNANVQTLSATGATQQAWISGPENATPLVYVGGTRYITRGGDSLRLMNGPLPVWTRHVPETSKAWRYVRMFDSSFVRIREVDSGDSTLMRIQRWTFDCRLVDSLVLVFPEKTIDTPCVLLRDLDSGLIVLRSAKGIRMTVLNRRLQAAVVDSLVSEGTKTGPVTGIAFGDTVIAMWQDGRWGGNDIYASRMVVPRTNVRAPIVPNPIAPFSVDEWNQRPVIDPRFHDSGLQDVPALTVAPIPVVEFMNVSITAPIGGDMTLEIVDITGSRARHINLGYHAAGEYQHSVDVRELAPGFYLLTVAIGGRVECRPVIVVRR